MNLAGPHNGEGHAGGECAERGLCSPQSGPMLARMATVRAPAPTLDAGPGLAEKRVPLPDGRSMRIVVAGSGNPLVVFEAGIGIPASMWGTV